jgi:hypothetical protein
MKPKFLSDVLRQTSPRKFPSNRYNILRDASPADSLRSDASFRPRSQSVKRKNSGDFSSQPSYANVVNSAQPDSEQEINKIEEVSTGICTVRSLCEKASKDLKASSVDPVVSSVFSALNEAILGLSNNQKILLDIYSSKNPDTTSRNTGNLGEFVTQKRPRQDSNLNSYVDLATLSTRPRTNAPVLRNTDRQVDPQVKKFKDTVRDAEKSTLVFNLNLGKTPIINQETMSTRVTKAITAKAAETDGVRGSIPKEDTVSALDDVLSIVKGMKFYGKSTKTYTNTRDTLSGSYCTIPVRYDFADKESRMFAETVFRDKCKLQCSTPYPLILRETIKQVVEQVKDQHPGHFVKVNVDTSDMTLVVWRRPMLAEGEKGKKFWTKTYDGIPIPPECLDINARRIPERYHVKLPATVNVVNTDSMSEDTASTHSNSQQVHTQNSGKKSRTESGPARK